MTKDSINSFYTVLKINTYYLSKHYYLRVFVMQSQCVLCEV